jgi:AraC-like DNA-binding protein
LAVKFRPGQLPRFFDFPASALTDTKASLQTLCGRSGREMETRLSDTRDITVLIGLLDQALITCLSRPHATAEDARMAMALETITLCKGQVRIGALAGALNLSRRQFERRFRETVGLTPKRMCRIARFLGVFTTLGSAKSPRLDWADLAIAHGYSDQAHLVRECKFFTGLSPLAYLKSRSAVEHTVMGGDRDTACAASPHASAKMAHLFNTSKAAPVRMLPNP